LQFASASDVWRSHSASISSFDCFPAMIVSLRTRLFGVESFLQDLHQRHGQHDRRPEHEAGGSEVHDAADGADEGHGGMQSEPVSDQHVLDIYQSKIRGILSPFPTFTYNKADTCLAGMSNATTS
jgi:hypothetical protein